MKDATTTTHPELVWFALPSESYSATLPLYLFCALAMAYLAALVFFFYTRHHPREV